MKISSFWVVTKPTKFSTLQDIVYRSTPQEIGLQFLGGLKPENVVAFYDDESSAMEKGRLLIHKEQRNEKQINKKPFQCRIDFKGEIRLGSFDNISDCAKFYEGFGLRFYGNQSPVTCKMSKGVTYYNAFVKSD